VQVRSPDSFTLAVVAEAEAGAKVVMVGRSILVALVTIQLRLAKLGMTAFLYNRWRIRLGYSDLSLRGLCGGIKILPVRAPYCTTRTTKTTKGKTYFSTNLPYFPYEFLNIPLKVPLSLPSQKLGFSSKQNNSRRHP
jgi:hypothetical protein